MFGKYTVMAFVAGALLAPPLVSAETADRGAQALAPGASSGIVVVNTKEK